MSLLVQKARNLRPDDAHLGVTVVVAIGIVIVIVFSVNVVIVIVVIVNVFIVVVIVMLLFFYCVTWQERRFPKLPEA